MIEVLAYRKPFTKTHSDPLPNHIYTLPQNPKLTRWCHETLLRILDSSLLPIYLDILQVLKAKCPVLVEHMIHSSMSMAGGEAFALLLKRPWNPAVGLYSTERQVGTLLREVGRHLSCRTKCTRTMFGYKSIFCRSSLKLPPSLSHFHMPRLVLEAGGE